MRYTIFCFVCVLFFPVFSHASFPDVPEDTPLAEAVNALKERGIVSGYPDGTFKPDRTVNRAEAIKIIIAQIATEEELNTHKSSVYADVGSGEWYMRYVEYARTKGVIDGPPTKTSFFGVNPVLHAEFIKMLTLASNINPRDVTNDMILPLSVDVTDPNAWYFPYMRYGIVSSMSRIDPGGYLHPGKELTRGDTAMMFYYFLLSQEKRRSQALLAQVEAEMVATIKMLEAGDMDDALRACARAMLSARGALAQRPDDPLMQGAAKIAGGIYFLVQTHQAFYEPDYQGAISRAKDVWQRAEEAKGLSHKLAPLAGEMQRIAKKLADEARARGGSL